MTIIIAIKKKKTITVLTMLIITIPSAIASWIRVIPGGFWLVGNSFGWFAVLVVIIATQPFAFCLTVLFALVRLVPALIEQFLWKDDHAFSQDQLLCGYILPISFGTRFGESFFLDDEFLTSPR